MIFGGLEGLVLSGLMNLAQIEVCPVSPPPTVKVHFSMEPLFISEKFPAKSLKKTLGKDIESTVATDDRSIMFGVTTSRTDGQLKVSYTRISDQSGSTICVYVDKATFVINYAPAVFIASDIKDLPCSYQVTRAHEAEHVKIDVAAIQEYIPQLEVDVLLYLKSLGYQGFGPYRPADAEKQKQVLSQNIMAAGVPMLEKLRIARRDRQGAIDTEENYKKESDKCPQEKALIKRRFYSGE